MLNLVNSSLSDCEIDSVSALGRTAVVGRLETGFFSGVAQVTDSKRCVRRGKMFAPAALAGMSAFCLSASAAVASDSISMEPTVVLRPDAMTGLVANATHGVESDDFVVITRPTQLGNSKLLTETKQNAPEIRMEELPPKRPGMILYAGEVLKDPPLRPNVLEIVGTVPIKRTELLLALDAAVPQPTAIAIQEAAADVPRMTKDTLLADVLEAFAEGSDSGYSDINWEFASKDLSEAPDQFETWADVRVNSFEAAPVLRPNYFGELHCLAEAIYFEARGEKKVGQQAVAEVIINRVKSDKFPDKICEVVSQGGSYRDKCQFSFNCDGLPESISEKDAYAEVRMLAFRALQGEIKPVVGEATHFHATWANPRWASVFEKTAEIGRHVFYHEQVN